MLAAFNTAGNTRKVDIRLPGTGNSNSHGARTVHQKHRWIRTSRLSIKNSLSKRDLHRIVEVGEGQGQPHHHLHIPVAQGAGLPSEKATPRKNFCLRTKTKIWP